MIAAIKQDLPLYEQLERLPENLVGEIIDGTLYTQPRPAGPHALAGSALGMELGPPYQQGKGGPGGWWIIDEPELHFVRDTEVVVPDLAGWRRERMPSVPAGHRFEIIPDWVCEILSQSSAKTDRVEKMPLYARYGVGHLWLLDPEAQILEVYVLEKGAWVVAGLYKEDAVVRVAPFADVDIRLRDLWGCA